MNGVRGIIMTVFAIALAFSYTEKSVRARERSQVAPEYKWRLQDLYPSDQAWSEAKQQLAGRLDEITRYKGKLASSASTLLACMKLDSEISKEFGRLFSYASMESDEDTRNSKHLGMKQELQQLGTNYTSKSAFIVPEIAEMDKAQIDAFIKQEPDLKIYKMALDNILRMKPHTLSDKEEKIVAEAGLMAPAPSSIYGVFSDAEMPYPEIKLSDGTMAKLTKAGYTRYRAVPNREDREAVFKAFWGAFDQFKATFGTDLYAEVKKDMFYARARHYDSSLHSALDKNNIPVEVYSALIKNVNDNLDSFYRYLNLKKRMLGVKTLEYSDVYAPVVKGIDLLSSSFSTRSSRWDPITSTSWKGPSPIGGSTFIRRRASGRAPIPTAAPTTCIPTYC
jgi:oligoendopeptidase F